MADTLVLQVPKNRALEFVANLSKSPLVEYAEKDELAFTQEIPNDPYYPNQWGLNKIKAPGGWDVSHGSGTVKIAIADTGIDGTHPDLGAKIAAAVDCTRSCAAVSSTGLKPRAGGRSNPSSRIRRRYTSSRRKKLLGLRCGAN